VFAQSFVVNILIFLRTHHRCLLRLRQWRLLACCHWRNKLIMFFYMHFVIRFIVLSQIDRILLCLVPNVVVRERHIRYVLLNDIRFFFVSAAVPTVLVLVSFYLVLPFCTLSLSVVVYKE
jgi:hypothetical protein